jgi:hypothetical protein
MIRAAAIGLLAGACLTTGKSVVAQTMELRKDCDTLSAPGHYPDYEPLPAFSIQRRESPPKQLTTLVMQIDAPPTSFNETSLLRLVCKLGSDYPHAEKIEALLFDDKKAARNLAAGFTDQKNYEILLWHLRAL